LKTKIRFLFFTLFTAFILISFSDPYTIKRISDQNFRYEFYVTDKSVTPKSNKIYYWFKGGAIHNAQGGFGGALLNNKFLKTYHSNQIAEQGIFKNGLKVGIWKTWHTNGLIETTQKWSKGLRTGMYYEYDKNGIVSEIGCYKNDKKHGKWYDFIKKDTTNYKNGILAVEKQKLSKLDKITSKLQALKDDADKKAAIDSEKDKITAAKITEKEYIEAQKRVLENEKANAKLRKKEAKEAKIATRKAAKANKKAEKEASINSKPTPKKDNFFNKLYDRFFSKKTSK
jgi:hypothetical protein